jgi:predicted glutamine amidotransferase
MCGLTGYARLASGPNDGLCKVAFEELMLATKHRGTHATGFAAFRRDHPPLIWKKAVDAKTAIESTAWKDATAGIVKDTEVVMGHVRYATHDNSHLDEAAHPFQYGKVIGAHNGVISNWRQIETELRPIDKMKPWIVDSEAAFALLDREKKPAAALRRLHGWFALSWVKGRSLFFCRSTGTTLAGAYVPALRALFWNSERKVLMDVLKNLNLAPYDIWEFLPETVYRYDPNQFTSKSANAVKTGVQFSKEATRTYPVAVAPRRKDDGWRDRWNAVTGKLESSAIKPYPSHYDLVRTVEEQDKVIAGLRARIDVLEAEIDNVYDILNAVGLIEKTVEPEPNPQLELPSPPEVPRCAICKGTRGKLFRSVDGSGEYFHETCPGQTTQQTATIPEDREQADGYDFTE